MAPLRRRRKARVAGVGKGKKAMRIGQRRRQTSHLGLNVIQGKGLNFIPAVKVERDVVEWMYF